MRPAKPDFTKTVDVLAFLGHAFGACSCSDLVELIQPIIRVLNWADGQKVAIDYDGVFYIVAGILTNWGLLEHGTSIRSSWIMDEGIQLLHCLRHRDEDIADASGRAYDGLEYGK